MLVYAPLHSYSYLTTRLKETHHHRGIYLWKWIVECHSFVPCVHAYDHVVTKQLRSVLNHEMDSHQVIQEQPCKDSTD